MLFSDLDERKVVAWIIKLNNQTLVTTSWQVAVKVQILLAVYHHYFLGSRTIHLCFVREFLFGESLEVRFGNLTS